MDLNARVPILEYYDHFLLTDVDAQGGYARVAEVTSLTESGKPQRAFKVMRKESVEGKKLDWAKTFENRFIKEFEILQKIQGAHPMFSRFYDSGFVHRDILEALETFKEEVPGSVQALPTGLDFENFKATGAALRERYGDQYLPYLVVELAPYDNSLYRMVTNRSHFFYVDDEFDFVSRFGIGDILQAAVQLLEGLQIFHQKTGYFYWDLKPEHIYWGLEDGAQEMVLRLIDYNVPCEIEPGTKEQNIKFEIANVCGALLYPALVMRTLSNGGDYEAIPGKGSHPSGDVEKRYATKEDIRFYQAEGYLDEDIKNILRRGLNPEESYASLGELKQALQQYAKDKLGMDLSDPGKDTSAGREYREGLLALRKGLRLLTQARGRFRQALSEARDSNNADEYLHLLKAVDYALDHYVLP